MEIAAFWSVLEIEVENSMGQYQLCQALKANPGATLVYLRWAITWHNSRPSAAPKTSVAITA